MANMHKSTSNQPRHLYRKMAHVVEWLRIEIICVGRAVRHCSGIIAKRKRFSFLGKEADSGSPNVGLIWELSIAKIFWSKEMVGPGRTHIALEVPRVSLPNQCYLVSQGWNIATTVSKNCVCVWEIEIITRWICCCIRKPIFNVV